MCVVLWGWRQGGGLPASPPSLCMSFHIPCLCATGGQVGHYFVYYKKHDSVDMLCAMDLWKAQRPELVPGGTALESCEFSIHWDKHRLFRAPTPKDAAAWVDCLRKIQATRPKTAPPARKSATGVGAGAGASASAARPAEPVRVLVVLGVRMEPLTACVRVCFHRPSTPTPLSRNQNAKDSQTNPQPNLDAAVVVLCLEAQHKPPPPPKNFVHYPPIFVLVPFMRPGFPPNSPTPVPPLWLPAHPTATTRRPTPTQTPPLQPLRWTAR